MRVKEGKEKGKGKEIECKDEVVNYSHLEKEWGRKRGGKGRV